jgi:hypothetical protein
MKNYIDKIRIKPSKNFTNAFFMAISQPKKDTKARDELIAKISFIAFIILFSLALMLMFEGAIHLK